MVFHKNLIQITDDVLLRRNMKGGENMKLKMIALGLVVTALMVSMVPLVFASCGCECECEYTPGYWKHNVTVYVEDRDPTSYAADADGIKESDASMEAYEAWIIANKDSSFTLEGAYDDFWARGHGVQPIRQEIADWFNLAKAA